MLPTSCTPPLAAPHPSCADICPSTQMWALAPSSMRDPLGQERRGASEASRRASALPGAVSYHLLSPRPAPLGRAGGGQEGSRPELGVSRTCCTLMALAPRAMPGNTGGCDPPEKGQGHPAQDARAAGPGHGERPGEDMAAWSEPRQGDKAKGRPRCRAEDWVTLLARGSSLGPGCEWGCPGHLGGHVPPILEGPLETGPLPGGGAHLTYWTPENSHSGHRTGAGLLVLAGRRGRERGCRPRLPAPLHTHTLSKRPLRLQPHHPA